MTSMPRIIEQLRSGQKVNEVFNSAVVIVVVVQTGL